MIFHKLRHIVIERFLKQPFENDDEVYLHFMSFAANAFALLVHVYLLAVMLFARQWLFFSFNCFSVLYYVLAFRIVNRRHYAAFGLMLSIEVVIYATLFGMLAGIGTYTVAYYMLVLVMQATVPYGTHRMRIVILSLTAACAIASAVADVLASPLITFTPTVNNVLLISNIAIMVVGTVLELYIGNLARHMIRRVSDTRFAELSSQAHTDPLTGLFNRWYAKQFFASPATRDGSCVAMLDIDDFKQVNDQYGHACGDEVLRFLADFLRKGLRKSDVIFRWGGEEFLIVLTGIGLAEAVDVLDKLRQELSLSTISTRQAELTVTVTIGVAVLRPDAVDSSIEESDACLYAGKRSGKNRVVSSPAAPAQN